MMRADPRTPAAARALVLSLGAGTALLALLARGRLLPAALAVAATAVATALALGRRRLQRRLGRLEAELEGCHARLATIHSLAHEITASHDPLRLCGALERECRKLLHADFFYVCRVEREQSSPQLIYAMRRDGLRESAPRPFPAPLAAELLAARRPLRLAADGPRPLPPLDPERPEAGVRAWLLVPLLVEHRPVGVLAVGRVQGGAYSPEDERLLTSLGQQVALALENARHYELATTDALTGLHLRPYFFRRLREEHERARRYRGHFALLMLDLDDFKRINDTHGHLCGDRYLRALGGAVRSGLRAADLACRYGGDEFCLLLPETDLRGAQRIAERLRQEVASLVVQVDDLELRTTASIGIAVYPEHGGEEARALLQRADAALYRAKKLGRDRVVPFAA